MISKVHIETHEKNGVTKLKSAFFTTPFKVVDIREDKKNTLLELILMSASPGILDEDELYFDYLLHKNSKLELTSQSFQRLFTMKKRAIQTTNVTLKENASLFYLPQPCVPHKASNFKSTNHIYLEKNTTLIWGEILTCGRKIKNEIFEFTNYQNITKVYKENKLILFENLYLNPTESNPMHLGQFEGYTHQLSLIFLNDSSNIDTLKTKIYNYLETKDCLFGASETPTNGIIVKILHFKAEKLMQWMKALTNIIKDDRF
ncbi:urease accessory protein UreD [Flavivirga jejuensis]|uniref:Urease accessory protein UreD n=1 Tax=Flavivirga jejuensis TaxID=870487 RepID=A0ABT8WKW6_9FLAO|nr:urease accessory protein UreD [Flavivirga jejuensis]MDO5973629.1 urease accessory protein UreD [Flavivirga jejuensis]